MEPVDALLRVMTKLQQKAQLCALYGGSGNSSDVPDSSNLYPQTSPMLHAARCGNSEAFSLLTRFTRELLGRWQVCWALVVYSDHPEL